MVLIPEDTATSFISGKRIPDRKGRVNKLSSSRRFAEVFLRPKPETIGQW